MLSFLIRALKSPNDQYSTKLQKEGTQQKTLLDLAWKRDDLSRLLQIGRELSVTIPIKIDNLKDPSIDFVTSNMPRPIGGKTGHVH